MVYLLPHPDWGDMSFMRQKIKHFSRKLRSFLTRTLTTRSTRGSGLGVYIRRTIRHLNLQQIIGVNLASFAFFAGVVVPQTHEAFSSLEVSLQTQETVVVVDTSPSTFQWPLIQFGFSQHFSYYHPGVDLTDPVGTSVYPIGDGVVDWVQQLPYGYGRHLLITHPDGIKSLYAHLSTIRVREGERVTKETAIGEVGLTGHTTGSHLHLEIYQNNNPTNPLDVLPQIKIVTPTIVALPKT